MLQRIVSKMSDPEECKLCHNPEKPFRPIERLRNELTPQFHKKLFMPFLPKIYGSPGIGYK